MAKKAGLPVGGRDTGPATVRAVTCYLTMRASVGVLSKPRIGPDQREREICIVGLISLGSQDMSDDSNR